jgi:hypothetical protein
MTRPPPVEKVEGSWNPDRPADICRDAEDAPAHREQGTLAAGTATARLVPLPWICCCSDDVVDGLADW